jgi:hypothetical protein
VKQIKTKQYCQGLMQCSRTITRGFSFALLGFFGCLSLSSHAATVYLNNFYSNDFQDTIGTEWTTTAASGIHTASAPLVDYGGDRLFLGEYGNDTLTLSLGGLTAHTTATVSFSLYLIRSWDGNDTTEVNGDPLGPDTWSLGVAGGPTLLSATFSNGNRVAGQSYSPFPGALSCNPGYNAVYPAGTYNPMTGASECYSLGYTFTDPNVTDEHMDSVYNFSFMFAHNASDLVLDFSAAGLQGLADESWGLDNVQVAVAPVPVPPAVWLFGSGLLGLIGLARRNK